MASLSLQPGQIVGKRYRLRQMIGVGGMGAVWSARDETDHRDVAVKLLHPALLRDPLIVQRFVQEAELGAPLRHPFIIETYASGRHLPPDSREAIPYLVTELLDGEPLSDVLRRVGTLPLGPALAILRDVSQAADAAHRAGVLHRDLKPANVFLHLRDGHVTPKVLDFGVSKALDPTLDVGLTTTGMLLGSPSYMSPEQALGKRDLDARSDVWSIGVMLHRVLTGKSLFAITGAPGMLKHIAEKDVTLDDLPEIPPEVLSILRRCLRRDRSERFAHASDLAEALQATILALGLETDLAPLLVASHGQEQDAHAPPEEAGGATTAEAPDAATVALAPGATASPEETETRLVVSVPTRRATGWALPLVLVAGAASVSAFVLASRGAPAPTAASAPDVAPSPPLAASLSSVASSSQAPAQPTVSRVPPAPSPPVQPSPPTPARRVRPPVAPAAPSKPSDVARRPGF